MRDWIYLQTIEIIKSKYNGEIKITKYRGKYSVWVGGFEQSGSIYVERIWRKALNNLPASKAGATIQQRNNVLILGLGCGTIIPLILKKWPKAKITGVEVDPVMVALGEKYFGLGGYKNLKIVLADARKFKGHKKFDLVLADAYVGNKKRIRRNLRQFLAPGGIVVTNNLRGLKNEITCRL